MLTEILYQFLFIPFEAFQLASKNHPSLARKYSKTSMKTQLRFHIKEAFLKLDFNEDAIFHSGDLPIVTTRLDKHFIEDLEEHHQVILAYLMHMHLNSMGWGLFWDNYEDEEMQREAFAYNHLFHEEFEWDAIAKIGKYTLEDSIWEDLELTVMDEFKKPLMDRDTPLKDQAYINAVWELYSHAVSCVYMDLP